MCCSNEGKQVTKVELVNWGSLQVFDFIVELNQPVGLPAPNSIFFFTLVDNWEREQHAFRSLGYGKWELVLPAHQAPKHQSIIKVCKHELAFKLDFMTPSLYVMQCQTSINWMPGKPNCSPLHRVVNTKLDVNANECIMCALTACMAIKFYLKKILNHAECQKKLRLVTVF